MAKTKVIAKALVLDDNDDFLLLTRSDTHPLLAGYYDLPGGMVEQSEEPGSAVVREIYEETELNLLRDSLKILYTTTQFLHGKSYPTLLYVVRVKDVKPEVHISWEHKAFEWAPMEKLIEVEPQLAPTYREALDYISEHKILEDI